MPITPAFLSLVLQIHPARTVRSGAECLADQDDAYGSTDAHGDEDDQAHYLYGLEPARVGSRVQVQGGEDENEYLARDNCDGANNAEGGVGRAGALFNFPDAGDGQPGFEVLEDGLQDEDAGEDAEKHVD